MIFGCTKSSKFWLDLAIFATSDVFVIMSTNNPLWSYYSVPTYWISLTSLLYDLV